MTTVPATAELPLLAVGLMPATEALLRRAGVPVVAPGTDNLLPELPGGTIPRFVLFDARQADSRRLARRAVGHGCEAIDVFSINLERSDSRERRTGSGSASSTVRRESGHRLLAGLRREIERRGGIWCTVADYPSPWRAAVLFEDAAADSLLRSSLFRSRDLLCGCFGTSAGQTPFALPLAVLRQRYIARLPLVVEGFQNQDCQRSLDEHPHEFPLLWSTTWSQFAAWWQARLKLQVTLSVAGGRTEILVDGPHDGWRPVLELWRGEHIARLPVTDSRITLPETGLIYTQASGLIAGGLTSVWSDYVSAHAGLLACDPHPA